MLGACIGDIVGSVYEYGNWKSKDFPLFSEKSEFTDDTVCTIAVAESLLDSSDPAAALRSWGRRYPHPKGGYGGRYAVWLKDPKMGPYGSYGNGAAMRVSPAAWLARSLEEALVFARHVTAVTHDHPEGIKGAEATVFAIWLARQGETPGAIRKRIQDSFGYDLSRSVDEIRPDYRFNEICQDTVPQAIVCALEANSFEDAIRNAISLGGDADTLAAIAGPIAEVLYGIPEDIRRKGWMRLPKDMRNVLERLYEKSGAG
ncbi:MAG: ADP-ribosylglycohydrolase family protein [Zoogloeaceae bacterium]|nr:ADP-ribosylglycohydrolase family protein [Zoogloeaceae bacterium]